MVLTLAILTAIALMGCRLISTDASNERLFLHHSEAYQVFQRFRAIFGSDQTILVALHDPAQSLLSPDGIAAIRALTQAMTTLPHVSSVVSLTTVRDLANLRITPFGIAAPPLIEGDRLSETQKASIRTNELVIGTLLSTDFHTAGLLVTPDVADLPPEAKRTWIAKIRALIPDHATRGRNLYIAGTLLERHDVGAYLQRDQRITIPLVFVILLLATLGLYRSFRLALIPLVCMSLALCWTMGMVGFSGLPLNLITSLLPPIIMVVSISSAIHLLNRFLDIRTDGSPHVEAVQQTMQSVGVACLLATLTTMMGFFSLLVSPVPAVQEFAGLAGIGIGLAFLSTMITVPLALLGCGPLIAPPPRHDGRSFVSIQNLLDRCFYCISIHPKRVYLAAGMVLLLFLPGLTWLQEGTDIVRALNRRAPLRISTEFIDQHLSGTNALELFLNLPSTGTNATFIRQVLAFSHWLREQPDVTSVYSPWEPLRYVSAAQRNDDAQLQVLATLLPLALPLEYWFNSDAQALRIRVSVKAMESNRLLALAERIMQQANTADLDIQLTGTSYLLAQMARTLVFTQLSSLALAAVLILGSITLALRSWQLGIIAAIPNLLPPVMLFGFMGWCGFTLSTATTMIASVMLGLIVDNTIHLLHRYRSSTRTGLRSTQALGAAIHQTGRAVVITTLILILGFWAGLIGSFKPTIAFSFLTGLTMIFALLADLLILPATLLLWQRSRQYQTRG